jgi:two-component system response regulator AlgR
MKLLVADDEPLARSRLTRLIEEIGGHQIVADARNGREALEQCARYSPDVLLLDIRMPDMDGLEAAAHLAQLDSPPAVIFTTAYDEHALAAFEARAVDYLLKPIRREKLETALHKARSVSRAQLHALGRLDDSGRSHISAQAGGNLQLVALGDVIYFQADQKYVTVRHRNGTMLIEDSLKSLEEEFGERFLRVHRAALVASDFVKSLEKAPEGGYLLRLNIVEDTLEVSRRHVAEVRRFLKRLGKGKNG